MFFRYINISISTFCLIFTCVPTLAQDKDSLDLNYVYIPDQQAKEAVSKIVKYTGLLPNFTVVSKKVSTAVAYIKGGKRYIAYNPEFIERLRDKTKTDWAAVSVLAHEIGHHLQGHTLKHKGNAGDELQADKFSGFILHQMGATLPETKAALLMLGDNLDTLYHPPKKARLDAIVGGWLDAANITDRDAYEESTFKKDTSGKVEFVYKCTFRGDDHTYLVDSKDRIIWFDNYGKPIVIGKKAPSQTRNYDWIYVYNDQYYGVDRKGQIWNQTTTGMLFIIGKVNVIEKPEVLRVPDQ